MGHGGSEHEWITPMNMEYVNTRLTRPHYGPLMPNLLINTHHYEVYKATEQGTSVQLVMRNHTESYTASKLCTGHLQQSQEMEL